MRNGKEVHQLKGHKSPLWAVSISQDGKLALMGGGGWETTGPPGLFGSPGRFIDTAILLWSIDEVREVRRFVGSAATIATAAISPNGNRIAAGGKDCRLRMWDAKSGEQLWLHYDLYHSHPIQSVAFTADGNRVVLADTSRIHLLNAKTGTELAQVQRDTSYDIAISPDGRYLLSSWREGLHLWELGK